MLTTRPAVLSDLPALAELFDAYRQFYQQTADLNGAEAFVRARLQAQDTHFICAEIDSDMVGFTHLFPSFTSVRMARVFILNDLFVSSTARGKGVGRALLAGAKDYGVEHGAVRLYLSTQHENTSAQALYESDGWSRSNGFVPYYFPLSKPGRGG